MTKLVIDPYVGVLPLKFGMKPKETIKLLGKPTHVDTNHYGNRIQNHPLISLGFSEHEELDEVVVSPGCELVFRDKDLFRVRDPIKYLRKFDSKPYLWVGFVVFYEIGIRVSGFHDKDESQKAIGVISKGLWDEYKDDFERYDG